MYKLNVLECERAYAMLQREEDSVSLCIIWKKNAGDASDSNLSQPDTIHIEFSFRDISEEYWIATMDRFLQFFFLSFNITITPSVISFHVSNTFNLIETWMIRKRDSFKKIYYQDTKKNASRLIYYFSKTPLINQEVENNQKAREIAISTFFYRQINKKKKRITQSRGQKNVYEQKSTSPIKILQKIVSITIRKRRILILLLITGIIGGQTHQMGYRAIIRYPADLFAEKQPRVSNICQPSATPTSSRPFAKLLNRFHLRI